MPALRIPVSLATLVPVAVALHAAPLRAQHAGPPVLRIPASTRALALGDAGAALADVDALFQNPAALATARGLAGGASRYGAGGTLLSVAMSLPVSPGGLALGVQHLDYAAACAACAAAIDASEGALAMDAALPAAASVVTLGFGRDLDGVRVGIAGKWVEQRLSTTRGGAFAVDVGVARRVGPVVVAAAAQNVGTRLRFDDAGVASRALPRRATLGVAMENRWVGPIDLGVAAQLSYLDGNELVPGGGVEIGYSPVEGYAVAGRIGVRRALDGDDGDVGPLSLGAAFTRDRITLEYAFQPLQARGDLHRIGLRLRP